MRQPARVTDLPPAERDALLHVSLARRRFPALRQLSPEQAVRTVAGDLLSPRQARRIVRALSPERGAVTAQLAASSSSAASTARSTNASAPSSPHGASVFDRLADDDKPRRRGMELRRERARREFEASRYKPFAPASPAKARDAIVVHAPSVHADVPYDAAVEAERERERRSRAARVSDSDLVARSTRQASELIASDCYIEGELSGTRRWQAQMARERGRQMLSTLHPTRAERQAMEQMYEGYLDAQLQDSLTMDASSPRRRGRSQPPPSLLGGGSSRSTPRRTNGAAHAL